MAFGQSGGPPASVKQVAYLQSLIVAAGFTDFREARHIYGLTQRQAAGKFTSPEASALIDILLGKAADEDEPEPLRLSDAPRRDDTVDARAQLIRSFPADLLADELRRRGWSVSDPA